jgi:hypothetical protein
MDGDSFADSFDNYSSSTTRNADGLFVSGTVELTAVPEPATAALLIALPCFAMSALRRRK